MSRRQELRSLTRDALDRREGSIEQRIANGRADPRRFWWKKEVGETIEQRKENKREFLKGGLYKSFNNLLDSTTKLLLDEVKTAIEPKVHSKGVLKSDKAAEIIGEKRDQDKEKTTIHNRYAKLNAVSIFKKANEKSISQQPAFLLVEKAVERRDINAVRTHLQAIRSEIETDNAHLQSHGIVDIETGRVTLHNGQTVELHRISNITRNTTNPFWQYHIHTVSDGGAPGAIVNCTNASMLTSRSTEHRINFKTGTIELANGTRIELDEIDWEKTRQGGKGTQLSLKQKSVLHIDGSTLDLKEAAKALDADAVANRQKYEHHRRQYAYEQMALLERVARNGSMSDIHAALTGIRTNDYALIKTAEDIARLKRADGSVAAYHFGEGVRKIRNDAINGLLHAHQEELNSASKDYTRVLKERAYSDIPHGLSRVYDSRTLLEVSSLQDDIVLPRYDELKATVNLSRREQGELRRIENRLQNSSSTITKNSYYLRKAVESAEMDRWNDVERHINSLQRVTVEPDASDILRYRNIYENKRIEHVRKAFLKYKENGNKNEVKMALYEERYHAAIIRHNTNRVKHALGNSVYTTGSGWISNQLRLADIRRMHLATMITDPTELTTEHEELKRAIRQSDDERMHRIDPQLKKGGTPEERAANFTEYARKKARFLVQKQIDETIDATEKAKLVDERSQYEKDAVERLTKLYSEERAREHDIEKITLARKSMNDFANRQFWLSIVSNAQMGVNSFDQGVDSVLANIIRSATKL